ncbi:MAG: BMP family ABC transporter substrate-binding protein [Oscillospiraceae bacterium]|jgi:basic membrane protein A|nr:BMP family ABC transporter substrate-binding protein [Oscillospiraceae bacterium]MCI9550219.1 BMP family ABC transporter substrate-binding protein [Oscillospiraceae bacterium]
MKFAMKKILAMLLAVVMVLSLAACTSGNPDPTQTASEPPASQPGTEESTEPSQAPTEEPPAPAGDNPDDIADTMTSSDNKYQVAFITDVGQLKDKSFNQGTFDGVKLYAAANGKSYKYYQPANGDAATDDDRYDAMKAAVEGGAEVIVCAGFMQEAALKKAAAEFPDVPFIFIDGYPIGLDNVAGISFQEEQSGYLAGYAVVKEGFEKLGFTGGGGGTNPACCRFGYGFVQGANDAAKELGKTVDINYSWQYGASFQASPELQTMMNGWYSNGTEIVFACGGSMFNSVAAAAAANDGLVVGVDVDQSAQSETVVTSAMKGLASSVQWAVAKVYDGTFSEIGGKGTSLGAKDDAVGLPTATWSLENYTIEEYEAQLADMASGKLVVDSMVAEEDFAKVTDTNWSNVALNYIG